MQRRNSPILRNILASVLNFSTNHARHRVHVQTAPASRLVFFCSECYAFDVLDRNLGSARTISVVLPP